MPGGALTAGPHRRWRTSDDGRAIHGVLAVVQPDGRFELELHLIVAWPPGPLEQLAADLRGRVRAAAKRARLEGQLGQIHVHIDGVAGPGEALIDGVAGPDQPLAGEQA